MVSSILPGANGAIGPGITISDLGERTTRTIGDQQAPANSTGDSIAIGDAAAWAAARESVRAGLEQVNSVLGLGSDAHAFLSAVEQAARTYGDDPQGAQAALDAALQGFQAKVREAIAGGNRLAGGDSISVQAEPGAAPLSIAGLDLKSGGVLGFGDNVQLSSDPSALLDGVDHARNALQAGLQKLSDQARALEAHQGFLGALSDAGVRTDLNADSARLLALQVRQDLQGLSGAGIANGEPQAVLALFRN